MLISRRRWITPNRDARVWSAGRWGPRRVRVSQCFATLRAEEWYTAFLKENADGVRPGARGHGICTLPGGAKVRASWEIQANAVWRNGRVFFRCQSCSRRCTRLYLPLRGLSPACRRCWGLTYDSQARLNYKDSLWGGRK